MTQSPQEKLAACPFCGNGNTLMVEHVEGTVLHPAYYVRCDNCGAIGPTTDNGGHADLWNSRPATLLSEHGEVVVTTDESGRCVAVTRQDGEGRILSTIWEASEHGGGGEAGHAGYLVDGKDFYYADFPRSEWSKHNSVVPLYLHPPTPSAPFRGLDSHGRPIYSDPPAVTITTTDRTTPSAPVVDEVANAAFKEFKSGQMIGETESMFWTRIARAALSGVSAPVGVEADLYRDDWISPAEMDKRLETLAEEYEWGGDELTTITERERMILIDFAHGIMSDDVFVAMMKAHHDPNAKGRPAALTPPAAAPRVEELDRQDLAKLLVASCVDLNAEQAEIALHDITDAGKEIGNWIVSVRRQGATPAASDEGEQA